MYIQCTMHKMKKKWGLSKYCEKTFSTTIVKNVMIIAAKSV